MQWANHLNASAIAAGKTPLLLNLDETNVPIVYVHSRGTYVVDNASEAWRSRPKQTATKADQRMNFTCVSIICNDSSIQPILPQVIFVSEKCVTKETWLNLCEALPPNVFVKRMKKEGVEQRERACHNPEAVRAYPSTIPSHEAAKYVL